MPKTCKILDTAIIENGSLKRKRKTEDSLNIFCKAYNKPQSPHNLNTKL